MELHQIRYFLAVCEALNFTRAAERCGVTQPALTRAVQKLEEELGGALLRRERARTHLTDFGRLMRPRLAQVLAGSQDAASTAASFLRLEHAPLSIGIMCTIGPMRFTAFLQALRTRHPGLEISLLDGTLHALKGRLAAGELDIAILAQPDPFPAEMHAAEIFREHFVVGFAKGHRLETLEVAPLRALHGESYLARLDCEFRDRLGEIHAAHGVEARICYSSAREEWIQVMAVAGFGLCLIPEFMPVVPGLQTRRIAEPEIVRSVCLVSMEGRRHSPPVRAFIAAARTFPWVEIPAAYAGFP